MGDRGTTHQTPTAETTEWDEILIQKGIVDRDDVLRKKGVDPDELRIKEAVKQAREEELEKTQNMTLEDKLQSNTLEELDDMEDDFQDEEEDLILQRMRDSRLASLKEKAKMALFGEVREISKPDWVAEVTEGSNYTPVVVHLFEKSVLDCSILSQALIEAARKFPSVKFLCIRSTSAIENYPDSNLPTLFVYKNGELMAQLIGLKEIGDKRTTALDLEWWMAKRGIVESELQENPRKGGINSVQVTRATGARRGGVNDDGYQ